MSYLRRFWLTVDGCCDKVDISVGTTTIMFGKHKYEVRVYHCKSCGSCKAQSYIRHLKENYDEYKGQ